MFISLLRGKRTIYIYIFIQTPLGSLRFEALSSSLELHPGGLNYSLALQCHTGKTAVLQAPTFGHMRSNDYSTTQIFVNNLLLSTLSIMSTNRCSTTGSATPGP